MALALSCIAFFVNDVRMIRASKVQELSALATILGANTTAAVEFNDAKTATELLSSLRQQPSVEFACLYDAHGRLLATYPAHLQEDVVAPPAPSKSGFTFVGSDRLDIVEKVAHGGDNVSTIYLRADMRELRRQIRDYLWITLAVLTISLAVSLLLARRLQRFVIAPILRLVEVMRRVTSRRRLFDPRGELGQRRIGRLERRLQRHARSDRTRAERPCSRPATNWRTASSSGPPNCKSPRRPPKRPTAPRANSWPT